MADFEVASTPPGTLTLRPTRPASYSCQRGAENARPCHDRGGCRRACRVAAPSMASEYASKDDYNSGVANQRFAPPPLPWAMLCARCNVRRDWARPRSRPILANGNPDKFASEQASNRIIRKFLDMFIHPRETSWPGKHPASSDRVGMEITPTPAPTCNLRGVAETRSARKSSIFNSPLTIRCPGLGT